MHATIAASSHTGSPAITSQAHPLSGAYLPAKLDGHSPEYRAWKQHRLQLQDRFNRAGAELPANSLSPAQAAVDSGADNATLARICDAVRQHGYSLYEFAETPTNVNAAVEQLHRQLSLTAHDTGVLQGGSGLSLLQDMSGTAQGRFVPYTARAMGWHTDGYYNDPAQTLRCFTLHCVHPAASGGTLSVVDPELLLIALYDDDPDLVMALCHPHSMTLPANRDDVGHDRPDRHVPVLFTHTDGSAGMRFTTRTRHISWQSENTLAAAERLAEIIELNPQWHHTIRLKSGQGIITRNILHRRDAFSDDASMPPRQMLRGRYLQLPTVK